LNHEAVTLGAYSSSLSKIARAKVFVPQKQKCVLAPLQTFPPSRLPVDPEGPRHDLSGWRQPEALGRLGPATPREFLQEGCGAAAKDVTNPERQAINK
jgi:hypothetical protein